ncbi:MAG: bifunctional 4-hydroxy-2-oxoglutarate aldolase/2-dehydro-3-deoxy-phosphogluconate aldolase [Desulfobulbaceae bacterium]|nr:bifunctional 4-hydroxy-2-oxoglutarate aldolase/2-dehydro-3-deoxy-phosphogluconate aldolase [Desulfobulbaceae bacterium]
MHLTIPVIGILRGVEASLFKSIMDASFAAGLEAIEVTMNTAGAEEIVADNITRVPEGRFLGMGTICCVEDAKRAIDAGAMFLVCPNLDTSVIEVAKANNTPVIAGALTPTEVYTAWSAGADMIKIFPCGSVGGPQYIKYLRGPFDDIPFIAVGGVERATLTEYFAAGVSAVGVGNSLFGKEALAQKDIDTLTRNVQEYVDKAVQAMTLNKPSN